MARSSRRDALALDRLSAFDRFAVGGVLLELRGKLWCRALTSSIALNDIGGRGCSALFHELIEAHATIDLEKPRVGSGFALSEDGAHVVERGSNDSAR